MQKSRLLRTSCFIAFAAASLPAAWAQGPVAPEEQSDVVIITATRREETVQTAPINIAAVGQAAEGVR